MKQEEYITGRVDKDFAWYDGKARLYRSLHVFSRITVIVVSAMISVLSTIEFKQKNLIIALLGALIVIVTGISELMKYKDQWLEFRVTAETIKSEKMLLETNTEPYDKSESFHLFVKNYETIVKNENKNWQSFISGK